MGKTPEESSNKGKGKATKVEDIENDNVTPITDAKSNDDADDLDGNTDVGGSGDPIVSPQEKLAALEKDFLYLRAEFENYKRNAIQERSNMVKYGAERLARDLLETLDIFHQAFEAEVTEDNYKTFVEGIKMTKEQMVTALDRHGIKEVPSVGEVFDPNHHEALGNEPSEDVPVGHVTRVFKAPYKYHDKLLRAGQVFVAQEPAKKD